MATGQGARGSGPSGARPRSRPGDSGPPVRARVQERRLLTPRDRLLAACRREIARRLAARPKVAVPGLVAECRSGSPSGALVLLGVLARVLGTVPGRLRARDLLDELFDLRPAERKGLTRKERDALAERAGSEPLAMLLLEELRAVTTRTAWDTLGTTITPPPLTDAQWLNVLLGLRVDEWVRTLAPAVSTAAIRDSAR